VSYGGRYGHHIFATPKRKHLHRSKDTTYIQKPEKKAYKLTIKLSLPKKEYSMWHLSTAPKDGTLSTESFRYRNNLLRALNYFHGVCDTTVTWDLVTITHHLIYKYRATTSYMTIKSIIIFLTCLTHCYRKSLHGTRHSIKLHTKIDHRPLPLPYGFIYSTTFMGVKDYRWISLWLKKTTKSLS